MGAALETLAGSLSTSSQTAGVYAALTVNPTQSYTVRATQTDQAGSMLHPWAQFDVAGYLQIKSARMHDDVIGTTFAAQIDTNANALVPLAGPDYAEPVYNTDQLTVQFTPVATISSAKVLVAGFHIYYPSLGGINANLITPQALAGMMMNGQKGVGQHYVSWVSTANGATAGQYGAGALINSVNDQFKAGHSYALIGYLPQTSCAIVAIQGTDTGNLYVGGPGTLDPMTTRDYFVRLSAAQSIAAIPVIQANNKGTTYVYVANGDATTGNIVVGLVWVDLGILPPVA